MKIPGIAYIIIGVFITGLSGYVYKFIPKPDGTPNMAMALFFFIGVVFIVVGVVKIIFKKAEDEQEIKYHEQRKELEKTVQQPAPSMHQRNRIEEQLNEASQQNQRQTAHTGQQSIPQNMQQHSNTYSRTHQYNGVHEQAAQNNQNSQNQAAHHASNQTTMNSMVIVVCKRCGNKNSASANYCHGCGNRLK